MLFLFLCVSFATWYYLCFPGVYYGDNAQILAESFPESGIGDQHSVLYTWLLRQCHYFFGFGVGYPFIGGLLMWHLGAGFVAFTLIKCGHNVIGFGAVLVLTWFPPVTFAMPHLQLKDFTMSAAFLAAMGFFAAVATNPKGAPSLILLSGLFFYIGLSLRHNAIFAILPVVGFCTMTLLRRFDQIRRLSVWQLRAAVFSVSTIALVVVYGAKSKIDSAMGDYKNYFIHGSIFSFDLCGMSVLEDSMLLPKERLMDGIDLSDLKRVFRHKGWDPLWGGWNSEKRILKGGENYEEYLAQRQLWMHTIVKFPGRYVEHRWKHFRRFLDVRNEYVRIGAWPKGQAWRITYSIMPDYMQGGSLTKIPPDAFEIRNLDRLTKIEDIQVGMMLHKGGRWLFGKYPYLVLASLFLGIILAFLLNKYSYSKSQPLLAVSMLCFTSGISYLIAYMVVSISSDWRYIHWSFLSTYLGFLFLLPNLGSIARDRIGIPRR
jgi:hypothetical protein